MSPSLRFVAMVIGAFANEAGEVRPSLDRLKADTSLSHSQIKRLRKELCKLGYLVPVKKGVGRGQASIYRLSFPQGKQLIEPSVKQLMQTPLHLQENGSSNEPLRETGSVTSLLQQGEESSKSNEGHLVSPNGDHVKFSTHYKEQDQQPVTTQDQTTTTNDVPSDEVWHYGLL